MTAEMEKEVEEWIEQKKQRERKERVEAKFNDEELKLIEQICSKAEIDYKSIDVEEASSLYNLRS